MFISNDTGSAGIYLGFHEISRLSGKHGHRPSGHGQHGQHADPNPNPNCNPNPNYYFT